DAVAKANGFTVVYAEGTDFGEGRHAWNTGHLLRRQVRDADDIAYFDALIDRLVADHGADPARVFMTGGSNGGMMTFVYAATRPERLAAAAPVIASMFSFDTVPSVPLPMLIINGAQDDEVPLEGGMSKNALVRSGQATPFKAVRDVVDFWVKANRSKREGVVSVKGTVTTTTHAATQGGAVTEFVLDSEGGHGWPGTKSRREGNAPIRAFKGADRVWQFFADKQRGGSKAAGDGAGKGAGAAAGAESKPTSPLFSVEVIDFPELADASRGAPGGGRKVPIKVHMPAGKGPFPVVVVSHGAGGDRDTHFGQAQDLAAHGYAVLCLEHVGSNRDRLKQGFRPMKNLDAMIRDADEVLARPKDFSFAIDCAQRWNQTHEKLKGKLDLDRVGAMWHSFGAFTTMVVCGMRPALDWLTP
ncbi:MAG: prolyl oligopeptidase family serine peptidase, partial [Planctomycetota bacterium]